jgi:hypothetical protein
MHRFSIALASFLACQTVFAGELEQIGLVKLEGKIANSTDISALAIVGDYLVIGSDETNRCQILKANNGGYTLLPGGDVVLADNDQEVDIEGICRRGRQVYVVGSHSYVRPRLHKEETYANNREQIEKIRVHPTRDVLARFSLQEDGKAVSIEKTSLRSVIDANPVLRSFARIPGKENGVNIEGLAIKGGELYIGFRSPVLHDNYVPVLICDFEHVDAAKLIYVNLKGLGIRDLTAASEGFLILAGPMGDGPGSYRIFYWNGFDCLPGVERREKPGEIRELCRIPQVGNEHAEGIVITKDEERFYEFLIVFDGPLNGGIKRFRLTKP